jgi:hypothetical protein
MSQFARERDIPYIIPFTSKSEEPQNNPTIYQINTPQTYLCSKASLAFISKYSSHNIVFITNETPSPNRLDFTNTLKEDLQQKNIPFKTVAFGKNFSQDLTGQLITNERNVIILSDDSSETLDKLTKSLRAIAESNPAFLISLFGYPVWQVYSAKFSEDFFLLNTSFYTVFYANPTDPKVRTFYNSYYQWYSRTPINTFPKYGILGYDTGMYFIQMIHQYGTSFSSHINQLKYEGIQTDFHFERINNWSGFINTNLFLVNYNPDYSITKDPF